MSERKIIRTPKGRLSFPALWTPDVQVDEQGNTKKEYVATVLIPKTEDISELKQAIDALLKEHCPKGVPAGVKRGIRDGAEKPHVAGYGDGVWFLTARSKNRPPVVDNMKQPIEDEARAFGGTWCKLSVTPFWYDKGMSKGVSFALNAVQILGGGEPFATVVDVDTAFDEEADEGAAAW